jgi:hypothetical protein
MEAALWSAVQRLRWLVLITLGCAVLPFVLGSRIDVFSAIAGGLAVALLAASVLPMTLAARRMRGGSSAAAEASFLPPYRTNPRAPDDHPIERSATRPAAIAFLLLALSGALLVVAAAAR